MTNDKAYIIRELRTNETELLKDFLYEAIFILKAWNLRKEILLKILN